MKSRAIRYLKNTGFAIAAAIGIVAAFVLYQMIALKQSLPPLEGTVATNGVRAPVRIARDKDGVPHIYAQSRDDALFALGFAHGQDRLWQMEVQRRIVQGRLSEIAGSSALVADTYLRSIGLYRAAQAAVEYLSPDARAALTAYTMGVNAGRRQQPLPPEFTILFFTPEPWAEADSLAVLKGLSVQLSGNAFSEIFRLQLLKLLGPEKAAQFFPPLPPDVVAAYRAYAPADTIKAVAALDSLGALAPVMERTGASNNWVVGGNKTTSGKPLLANDPHLALSLPAIWYLAHLSWPGGQAIGGSIPGIPAIIAGRTDHVAWGMTTTGADVQDLYWEKIDPAKPDHYLTSDGSRPFDVRQETIKIRFGSDKIIKIRSTAHGPLLPADEPRLQALVPEGFALALKWPALDPDDRTLETALGIFTAADASAESIERTFSTYRSPIQSFVYASDGGDVGLILPGTIPVRRADNPIRGLLPGNGRDPTFDWQGTMSYADGPHWSAREDGAFITANNNVVPTTYKGQVALDWEPEFRARRIAALLAPIAKHDVASFRAIQQDSVDQFAMDVVPLMLRQTKPSNARASEALKRLAAWDFQMRREKGGPLIYSAWFRAFAKAVYADELGELFDRVWRFQPDLMDAVLRGDAGAVKWCDDTRTAGKIETCDALLRESLDAALDELASEYGNDMSAWRWGTAHSAILGHTPFGFIPVLRDIFNRRVPLDGGTFTINRADYRFANREPYAAVHGSGYRAVYDLANPNNSIFIIATGQSGNVYSPYYDNFIERWADGKYLPMTTDAATIEANTSATLTLQPSPDIER